MFPTVDFFSCTFAHEFVFFWFAIQNYKLYGRVSGLSPLFFERKLKIGYLTFLSDSNKW